MEKKVGVKIKATQRVVHNLTEPEKGGITKRPQSTPRIRPGKYSNGSRLKSWTAPGPDIIQR